MEEDYKFLNRDQITDDRALFANKICDLLAKESDFSLRGSLGAIAIIRQYFEEHVRNIYELVDTQIPVFAYYDLSKVDADNYCWTEEQYQRNLEIARKAAIKYHGWE